LRWEIEACISAVSADSLARVSECECDWSSRFMMAWRRVRWVSVGRGGVSGTLYAVVGAAATARLWERDGISVPSSSATFMRKALRSSSTRLRPRSMKSSKRCVNWVIRSRRSLKLKSTEGRVSAMEGASVVYCAWEPEKDAPKRLGVAGIAAIVGVLLDGIEMWV
jgi:hypothetical protein